MAEAHNDLHELSEALADAANSLATCNAVLATGPNLMASRFQVDAHCQLGRGNTLLASTSSNTAAEEQEHWRAAYADYHETLRLLEDIPKSALLLIDKEKRDEASAGLSKCAAALQLASGD
jgi:hypothetical protein